MARNQQNIKCWVTKREVWRILKKRNWNTLFLIPFAFRDFMADPKRPSEFYDKVEELIENMICDLRTEYNIIVEEVMTEFLDALSKVINPAEYPELVRDIKAKEEFGNRMYCLIKDIAYKIEERNLRKELAVYIIQSKYCAILFCILDGKSCDKYIWKFIKPVYEPIFMQIEEEK